MEVRPVRPDELDRAGAAIAAAFATLPDIPPGEDVRARLLGMARRPSDAEVLVAVERDEILGCVTYVSGPSSALGAFDAPLTAGVQMLGVVPEARRRGVGRALVAACLDLGAISGCERVVLHATARAEEAQRLYQRMGFERAPELDSPAAGGRQLLAFRYWTDAAALLADARLSRRPLNHLPDHLVPETLDDAYRVQDRLVSALGHAGVGWKVSATSPTVQQHLGLSSPVAGHLLAGCVHPAGIHLDLDRYIGHPSLGAVIVVRLGADLAEGPFNAPAVAAAVSDVAAGLELLDSRFADPTDVGALALVADNGLAGDLIVGPGRAVEGLWDARDLPVQVVADGITLAEGLASDALGGPLHVLAWLAGHLAARRRPLRAGDLVATGSCTDLVAVPRGAKRLEARVGSLQRPLLLVEASCS